jgi:cell division protein FtsZ
MEQDKLKKSVKRIMDKTGSDKTIEEIARETIPHISVLGIGGAGCNIVSWMKKKGVTGANIYALNSDAQHLSIVNADRRVLLGYNRCGGLGCGGFPERGLEAAEESSEEIEKIISGSGLVFLTAGLGGGTGTGASPVIAKLAREIGALTVGVVTTPFQVEVARLAKAKAGLRRLFEFCDAVIVIDNNRLLKIAGNSPLSEAFALVNELIARFIKSVTETIVTPSLMNLNFADMKFIMMESGVCAIGVGEGMGNRKVEDAIEKAFDNPLLDVRDIRKAEGALVHIEGGNDMTLDDVNRAGEIVISRIAPHAKVSWGARVNSKMPGSTRATIVLSGVESPFLME